MAVANGMKSMQKDIHTVFPGLIRMAKFVVWSYWHMVDIFVLLVSLDPLVDHAPLGVSL